MEHAIDQVFVGAALAFAPMRLFFAYGLLTAITIGLALVATMAVCPVSSYW